MQTASNAQAPLLRISDLEVHFARSRGENPLLAVDGVNFDVLSGESFGLVGESGSGKTTIGRTIVGLQAPSQGRVHFDGMDLAFPSDQEQHRLRREIQIVFQDPFASLNPRRKIAESVLEPLVIHGLVHRRDRARIAGLWLERVGLLPSMADRYPHELSGGQRQRVGIARAICVNPRLVILDEPVSALDVSVQAQIMNLLADLKTELGLTYLFIAHNLALVRHFCDRVAVMKSGRIVELAGADRLFTAPRHPYTRSLLAAVLHVPAPPPTSA